MYITSRLLNFHSDTNQSPNATTCQSPLTLFLSQFKSTEASNMSQPNRAVKSGCLLLVCLIIGFLIAAAFEVYPRMRYSQRSRRTNNKIIALMNRKPTKLNEKQWEQYVGWASIAYCNICCSEGHASYKAVCRFEEQLDEKLKEEIQLETIDWIGDRLAETGPHGQRYMKNWREQWNEMIQAADQENAR